MDVIYPTILNSIEILQIDNSRFAIQWKGKVFYVGELLFCIIRLLKQGKDLSEIQCFLLAQYGKKVSVEKLQTIIEEDLVKKLTISETSIKDTYIKGKFRLLDENQLWQITDKLRFLFEKKSFLLIMFISLGVNIGFARFLFEESLFTHRISLKDGFHLIIINYIFYFFTGMAHEFGHAAAARKYNISSKEIGLGFYFLLPVLYTDVSQIWILGRYKRLLVNIGGIYFQLIINLFLIGIFAIVHTYFVPYQWIVISLFITNILIALYSLNPFLRNDGYWIYSDLFDIINLADQAREFPFTMYRVISKKSKISSIQKTVALALYSGLEYALFCLLPFGLYQLVHRLVLVGNEFITHSGHIENQSVLESSFLLIRQIFFCGFALVLSFKTVNLLYSRIKKFSSSTSVQTHFL